MKIFAKKVGTPNTVITVSGEGNSWMVYESIDHARESAWYENDTRRYGPFSTEKVQEIAAHEEWLLDDGSGRKVVGFKDFREIPKILEKEEAERWYQLTNSRSKPQEFKEAVAVALVADAINIFDTAPWNGGNVWESLKWTLRKEIKLSYDKEHRGVANNWKEAVQKYGLRIEPINKEGLKALRRQAEDQLRKSSWQLPNRLSAMLRAKEDRLSPLRLPK